MGLGDHDTSRQELPEVLSLAGGIYECHSCLPLYRVRRGRTGPCHRWWIRASTRLPITVVDDRTVRLVGRGASAIIYECTMTVAADGNTMTETRTAAIKVGNVLVPVMSTLAEATGRRSTTRPVRLSAVRVGSATAGAHLFRAAGRWSSWDLLNHDEDTTYRIAGGSLTMSDRMGRSFTASLDGAAAPYHGD